MGLQFPPGLIREAADAAKKIQETTDAVVLVSGQPTHGACDVPEMPVDLIVNFGHSPMPYLSDAATFFVEIADDVDVEPVLEEAVTRLRGKAALIAAIEYVPQLPHAKRFLEERGVPAVIGEGSARLAYPGQVLGCDFTAATGAGRDVDSYLYIGGGDFHPLGVAIATRKPVIAADPRLGEVRDMSEKADRILRQRHAAITLASGARRFGIVVSTKVGQDRGKMAEHLAEVCREAGREAVLFATDAVSPEALEAFDVDVWVNTACPRLATDDYMRWPKPMITPQELLIALGSRKWDEYVMDEIVGPRRGEGA